MWGYSDRTHGATGTLDPLMAKAVVLRVGDESAAIVALDLGRTPEDAVIDKIRERTKAGCGVANLFITASHTHHAPIMENTPDSVNPYADKVGDAIAKIICQAANSAEPVRDRRGARHGRFRPQSATVPARRPRGHAMAQCRARAHCSGRS